MQHGSGATSDRPGEQPSDFRRELERLRSEFSRLQQRLGRLDAPRSKPLEHDRPPGIPPHAPPDNPPAAPHPAEVEKNAPSGPRLEYELDQLRGEIADLRVRLARCETERGEYRTQAHEHLALVQQARAQLAERTAERDAAQALAEAYRQELSALAERQIEGGRGQSLRDEIQFLRFTLDRTVNEYMAARRLLEEERDRARADTDAMRRKLENCIGNSASMIMEWKERAELAEAKLAEIRMHFEGEDVPRSANPPAPGAHS